MISYCRLIPICLLFILLHSHSETVSFQQGQQNYSGSSCATIQGSNPLGRIIDWRWYSFGVPESSAGTTWSDQVC